MNEQITSPRNLVIIQKHRNVSKLFYGSHHHMLGLFFRLTKPPELWAQIRNLPWASFPLSWAPQENVPQDG